MKDTIIKIAILYPHLYPWRDIIKRNNVEIDIKELNALLKAEGIENENIRRKIGWLIEGIIFQKAVDCEDVEELVDKTLSKYEEVCEDLMTPSLDAVYGLINRKDFNDKNKLALYKDVLNGNFEAYKESKKKVVIDSWLIDLFVYYYISKPGDDELNEESIANYVSKNMRRILNNDDSINEVIKRRMALAGFRNVKNILAFRQVYLKNNEIFKNVIKNLLVEEVKEDNNEIFNDLMEMFDGITDNPVKTEKKENKNLETGALKKEMKKCTDIMSKSLKEIANEAGYNLIRKDYEDDEKLYRFVKELVDIRETAVLSQLYEAYINIESTDISNIKAALGNFFSHLMLNGLLPMEDEMKVGDRITAQSCDLLKKYRTTIPVEGDSFEAVVKYPGWEFEGKVIMQPIITPIKKDK